MRSRRGVTGLATIGLEMDRASASRSFDPKWLIIGTVVLIVAWLALIPLGFLLWQSFMTPASFANPAQFTLGNYAEVYTSAETFSLFGNSAGYALGSAILALVIGTGLAWMCERTNTPFKPFFYALSIVPMFMPGILFVTAWIMLASPNIGIINLLLQQAFDTDYVFVDVYTLSGMMWVDGIQHVPLAFLLMTAALKMMDPSLEESAIMSGASVWQTTFRITLRLASPAAAAAFLILFVRALESFETPALLGLPVGIQVFTSAIWEALHGYPSDIGLGSTYAVTLLALTAGGIYWQSRLARNANRYATVTGKGFRPRVIDLGRWRYFAAGLFILYSMLVIGLPFLVLLWSSLQTYYAVPSLEALQNVSLASYQAVLDFPSVGTAVWNSTLLALASASAVMFLTAVICWIVLRTQIRGRWLLDNIATMPLVMPGIVLGLSVMICYLTIGGGIYGTVWILLIAYMTRFMPYGMRFNSTAMLKIHKELEESAALSGASWFTIFYRVVLPLLKPGLIAGWIYIVIISVRELSSSILLYSPGSEVIAVVLWELWQNGQYTQLSALGVMLIVALFTFVMLAQMISRRVGIREVSA